MWSPNAIIVGAGLGGLLMALYLAKNGTNVRIFEKRPDMRTVYSEQGQSINMTLTTRGVTALKEVGVWNEVRSIGVPLYGRTIHNTSGSSHFHSYGKTKDEVLYSISRKTLNCVLLNAANAYPNISIQFAMSFEKLDKSAKTAYFRDHESDILLEVPSDLLIGADGAFSTVRQQMQRGEVSSYNQEFMEWGYKELSIPINAATLAELDVHSLHLWTHTECMLLAFPNTDGSFSCTLIMPIEGDCSFANLNNSIALNEFFSHFFPDVHSLMTNLETEFFTHPIGLFVTTCTNPWHFKDFVVLLGDACHSVFPFYGQGMNATFEDCRVLNQCLLSNDNLLDAFKSFQKLRKHNLDVLAELSRRNFYELRDGMRSRWTIKRRSIEHFLECFLPGTYQTLYSMVAHTNMQYSEAAKRDGQQRHILRCLGLDLVVGTLILVDIITALIRHAVNYHEGARNDAI